MTLRLLDVPMRKRCTHEGKVVHMVNAHYDTPIGPKWFNILTEPNRPLENILADMEQAFEEGRMVIHDPSKR